MKKHDLATLEGRIAFAEQHANEELARTEDLIPDDNESRSAVENYRSMLKEQLRLLAALKEARAYMNADEALSEGAKLNVDQLIFEALGGAL